VPAGKSGKGGLRSFLDIVGSKLARFQQPARTHGAVKCVNHIQDLRMKGCDNDPFRQAVCGDHVHQLLRQPGLQFLNLDMIDQAARKSVNRPSRVSIRSPEKK